LLRLNFDQSGSGPPVSTAFEAMDVAFQAAIGTRPLAEALQFTLQSRVEDAFHQSGLAAAAHTGDHGEHVQGKGHVDVLQIVFGRAAKDQFVLHLG
jgi:hypothetical protein